PRSDWLCRFQPETTTLKAALKLLFLAILAVACPDRAAAQLIISDNFNLGNGAAWAHYAPLQTAPWNEQVSWTFPADPEGGKAYRIFGGVPNISHDPAQGNNTGAARVGSCRNDSTYTDFSMAADIL